MTIDEFVQRDQAAQNNPNTLRPALSEPISTIAGNPTRWKRDVPNQDINALWTKKFGPPPAPEDRVKKPLPEPPFNVADATAYPGYEKMKEDWLSTGRIQNPVVPEQYNPFPERKFNEFYKPVQESSNAQREGWLKALSGINRMGAAGSGLMLAAGNRIDAEEAKNRIAALPHYEKAVVSGMEAQKGLFPYQKALLEAKAKHYEAESPRMMKLRQELEGNSGRYHAVKLIDQLVNTMKKHQIEKGSPMYDVYMQNIEQIRRNPQAYAPKGGIGIERKQASDSDTESDVFNN